VLFEKFLKVGANFISGEGGGSDGIVRLCLYRTRALSRAVSKLALSKITQFCKNVCLLVYLIGMCKVETIDSVILCFSFIKYRIVFTFSLIFFLLFLIRKSINRYFLNL